MFDQYNRNITYLRVSVTDRCNLRCVYCMPEGEIARLKREEILSIEEIVEVIQIGAKLGIEKIRLTGGEPLVRKGIVELVEMVSQIEGIREITMTTNGILLPRYANDLKKAGLKRVNISLDSTLPEQYERITRGGKLENVIEGIRAAKSAGLTPIKINVVKLSKVKQDLNALKEFAATEDAYVRFITQMNLKAGEFEQVDGGDGGNCIICNRLRLTANGMLKPCLFSNQEYSIKEYGIENAFLKALNAKPKKGAINQVGSFYNIGG